VISEERIKRLIRGFQKHKITRGSYIYQQN